MPYLYYAIAWIIIMFFQSVISPRISIAGIIPDVVIAAVVLIGMKRGWQKGLWFGFAFGLTMDLYDSTSLGWMTLATALAGMAAGVIREKIYVESRMYQTAMLAAIVFVHKLFVMFIDSPGFFLENAESSLLDSLLISLYTAFIAALVLILLQQRYRLKEFL